MKKIIVIIFLLFSTTLFAKFEGHVPYGFPGTDGQLVYREGYTLLHDNYKKVSLWVSYHLTSKDLQGTQKRTDDFKPDPNLPKGKKAELSDYKGSGYDRGHMAPAGDMKRSKKVMSESFYLSNMLPQFPSLNRGLWKKLEEGVRSYVKTFIKGYVICGPIFKDLNNDGIGDPLEKIGENKVWVPTHCYKIFIFHHNKEVQAFAYIMPNKKISGEIQQYLVTIDKIEALSGLDFLSELPDKIENKIESTINKKIYGNSGRFEKIKADEIILKLKETEKKELTQSYSGNFKTKVFHKDNCRYYNCKDCAVIFHARSSAVKDGYRPCKVCKP